jgi:arylsulfatase A-like enzyme
MKPPRRVASPLLPPLLLVRIALAVSLLVGWVGCAKAPAPPNLLLVVLDTTRADALSCYGNAAGTTPRLDALAAQGALFERAFSTDFWTLPSHASLFTGLHPSEHGATSETNRLSEEALTLAERLEAHGYATGAFVANPWVGIERGFGQGFQRFEETWRPGRKPGVSHRLDPGAVEDAQAWISAQVERGSPFFAFLNLNGAHLPYAPDPSVHAHLYPQPRPLERMARLKKIAGMWEYLGGAFRLDALDFEILRELYHAEVAMTDALVGRLADHLAALGVLDETVIVVTSDHGEHLGEHGLIDHTLSLYDPALRIPLLIRHPGKVAAGERRSELASLVDIMPTILALLGLADDEMAGRSLFVEGRMPREFVVAENERPTNGVELMRRAFPDFDADSIDERMRMVRTDRYKLIWRERNGLELYDLRSDPGEQHDLASDAPEQRDRLLELLRAWQGELAPPPTVSRLESTDTETLEQLRALGYAE